MSDSTSLYTHLALAPQVTAYLRSIQRDPAEMAIGELVAFLEGPEDSSTVSNVDVSEIGDDSESSDESSVVEKLGKMNGDSNPGSDVELDDSHFMSAGADDTEERRISEEFSVYQAVSSLYEKDVRNAINLKLILDEAQSRLRICASLLQIVNNPTFPQRRENRALIRLIHRLRKDLAKAEAYYDDEIHPRVRRDAEVNFKINDLLAFMNHGRRAAPTWEVLK
ncbi:hypothetical protein CPB83DRAFT_840688 [Crepidotus variabilis]|uniref:Uncharacterized protein n=1 Tax=Crepidotus variabilis TaxID=179855 RepID=A0A9P6E437_9AGAR|nr:hypothetical protein CPB83DRAFT_840688 [Crepidotus variabilis]